MKNTKNTALVITSIAGPESKVLQTYAKECGERDIPFIVIGDSKSPDNFHLNNCDFWDLDRQKTLQFSLAPILPTGHYSRKNLGYLNALKIGATTIVETDDDNYPLPDFWSALDRSRKIKAYDIKNEGWVNVYRYFSDDMIWPRGFPLEQIQEQAKDLSNFTNQEDCGKEAESVNRNRLNLKRTKRNRNRAGPVPKPATLPLSITARPPLAPCALPLSLN